MTQHAIEINLKQKTQGPLKRLGIWLGLRYGKQQLLQRKQIMETVHSSKFSH